MRSGQPRVSSVAHSPELVTLQNCIALTNSEICKMCEVKFMLSLSRRKPHNLATQCVPSNLGYDSINGCEHWSSASREDVHALMFPFPIIATIAPSAANCLNTHALDGI